jgi:hypothetical protein
MKIHTLVLFSLLAALPARAQNHPAANGGCPATTSGCAFKNTGGNVNPGPNQVMVVIAEGSQGSSFTGISDTYGVTWTAFSAGTGVWSNSNLGVTNVPVRAWWAKTGANSGAETITVTTSSAAAVVYYLASWAATDVNVSASNPEDTSVFKQDTNANSCTNPSPQSGTYSLGVTNDIVMSLISYNSNFDAPNLTSTSGPVQQSLTGVLGAAPISAGAVSGYANFSGAFTGSTGTLAPLAIQASVNTTWTWSGCVATAGNAGIYLVALKGPSTAPVRRNLSKIINFKPRSQPNSVPRSTPGLLYAILRNNKRTRDGSSA